MTGKALMIQGTGSDVGKSLIVAGLCRIAKQRGLKVAPFKPQNMSNNAAVCPDGGEIGRAQALQARASGLPLSVDFNPVLLKPETDRGAQVIVLGRPWKTLQAADYMARSRELTRAVHESFARLVTQYDLVLVEGAGSPAEVNLRANDIANMGFARLAQVPVCLVGDIDRGGVIASLVGTRSVLEPLDRVLIKSFLINKFRGDPSLFSDGLRIIEEHTGWASLGVIPWWPDVSRLPAEDALALAKSSSRFEGNQGVIRIAVPILSRMANFDDVDPLIIEPGVDVAFIAPGHPIPRECDVIILCGTKSTLGDLAALRTEGWDHDILAHARTGGRVLGLCGGFQMLGQSVQDPDGIDGSAGSARGLGLLSMTTKMDPHKTTRAVQGHCTVTGERVSGYEIHAGLSQGADLERAMVHLTDGRLDGARSPDGTIEGTYIHGIFSEDRYRKAWLNRIRSMPSEGLSYEAHIDQTIDQWAQHIASSVDVDRLLLDARVPQLPFAAAAPDMSA